MSAMKHLHSAGLALLFAFTTIGCGGSQGLQQFPPHFSGQREDEDNLSQASEPAESEFDGIRGLAQSDSLIATDTDWLIDSLAVLVDPLSIPVEAGIEIPFDQRGFGQQMDRKIMIVDKFKCLPG